MSNDLKCLPINFYLLTVFDALGDGLASHFSGIRRAVELHQEEVTFLLRLQTFFFISVPSFLRFKRF